MQPDKSLKLSISGGGNDYLPWLYTYTHRVVTFGILVYRDFLKYLITIQEFTICLNISIIHLKEKIKFIQKPFIKINGMLKDINF